MHTKIKSLWNLLRFTFGLVPIVAGLDKFTNILVQWDKYLTGIPEWVPITPRVFMSAVGIIEIAAGIAVIVFTKLGSYVVAVWLVLIAIVLISGGMFDVAVRDLVMAICAYVLGELTDLASEPTA